VSQAAYTGNSNASVTAQFGHGNVAAVFQH
jgi:hypothetical protein